MADLLGKTSGQTPHSWQTPPPWADTPLVTPQANTPPPRADSQQAGSMHPTGMQSF